MEMGEGEKGRKNQIVDGMSLFDGDLMLMVFITRTDIFKHGILIYTINRHSEETNELFDDGSHIVYVMETIRKKEGAGCPVDIR